MSSQLSLSERMHDLRAFLMKHGMVLIIIGGVLLVGSAVTVGWFWHRVEKEKTLSVELLKVVQQLGTLNIGQEMTLLEEETLENLKVTLGNLYEKHRSYKNGLTALNLLGNIEYQSGYLENAMSHYKEVAAHKKHFLAPKSLHAMICLSLENQDSYEAALNLIETFEARYHEDPLLGRVLLMKGETLEVLGRFTDAMEAYEAILVNGGLLPTIHREARYKKTLLISKGYLSSDKAALPLPSSGRSTPE